MPKNTESMRPPHPQQQASDEEADWLAMAPVAREFGSPDYERLTALDQAAYAAFQSWEKVREWLATPNPALGGLCPENAVRSANGFDTVMSILRRAGGHGRAPISHEAE